jgi:hypothetical protein
VEDAETKKTKKTKTEDKEEEEEEEEEEEKEEEEKKKRRIKKGVSAATSYDMKEGHTSMLLLASELPSELVPTLMASSYFIISVPASRACVKYNCDSVTFGDSMPFSVINSSR